MYSNGPVGFEGADGCMVTFVPRLAGLEFGSRIVMLTFEMSVNPRADETNSLTTTMLFPGAAFRLKYVVGVSELSRMFTVLAGKRAS